MHSTETIFDAVSKQLKFRKMFKQSVSSSNGQCANKMKGKREEWVRMGERTRIFTLRTGELDHPI